jgi:hypothetical protein
MSVPCRSGLAMLLQKSRGAASGAEHSDCDSNLNAAKAQRK